MWVSFPTTYVFNQNCIDGETVFKPETAAVSWCLCSFLVQQGWAPFSFHHLFPCGQLSVGLHATCGQGQNRHTCIACRCTQMCRLSPPFSMSLFSSQVAMRGRQQTDGQVISGPGATASPLLLSTFEFCMEMTQLRQTAIAYISWPLTPVFTTCVSPFPHMHICVCLPALHTSEKQGSVLKSLYYNKSASP